MNEGAHRFQWKGRREHHRGRHYTSSASLDLCLAINMQISDCCPVHVCVFVALTQINLREPANARALCKHPEMQLLSAAPYFLPPQADAGGLMCERETGVSRLKYYFSSLLLRFDVPSLKYSAGSLECYQQLFHNQSKE